MLYPQCTGVLIQTSPPTSTSSWQAAKGRSAARQHYHPLLVPHLSLLKRKKNQPTVNLINDSEDNPAPTEINHPATDSTQPVKLQELTNEQELRRAQKVHKAVISSTYTAYNPPELSDQLDKRGRKMIAYWF
ncbi:hypothetical protein PCANC_00327 [Puccinia coronata f. sp. avenae]|uniref:Uncharacterized protein n=1 Tax=Puccinia coronata f. sp. avenae TaxID=200324 RepID=A0A2N5W962_9BASI|nr:hypothetical protein PCANC_21845 [Puccinia coronata f. sp. avenae]PLW58783.1 hypothetical protein PCANC_00327 [Puccinia coronata f. sp. avenae]